MRSARFYAFLGAGAARGLFGYEDPIGKPLLLGPGAYRVVGVLDTQASGSATPNADAVVNWADIPQFPRSIMIKGLKVLLWGQKGFDTTQLVDDYNKELSAYMAQNQGAPVINLSSTSDLFLLDARRNTPDGSW